MGKYVVSHLASQHGQPRREWTDRSLSRHTLSHPAEEEMTFHDAGRLFFRGLFQ
jgi:hypothetical protein